MNHTVLDVSEALISGSTESWELSVTKDTKTHTVILDTVGDGSRNTRAPVGSLGISERTTGADVSVWNVDITIGNSGKTTISNQNVTCVASKTNSC